MERQLKCLVCVLLLAGALAGCGFGSSSNGENSQSNTQPEGYYRAYYGQTEWILVAPETLNSNQDYWIEYPAALINHSISCTWERVSSNTIACMPEPTFFYNQNYAGRQYVNAIGAQTFVTSVETSVDKDWNDMLTSNEIHAESDVPDTANATDMDSSPSGSGDLGN
jgi:hypothetical protein